MPKWFLILGLVACLIYGLAGSLQTVSRNQVATTADGRSWKITRADINEQVLPDGSLAVGEAITADFNGTFTGFYRDIPLFPNQEVKNLSVGDMDKDYKEEGSAQLGSSGRPGTWAQDRPSRDALRVVWHHQTSNSPRTFITGYELSNASERFKDGDVVRIRAWGQYWQSSVGKLSLILELPQTVKADIKAGPGWLEPKTSQQGKKVLLTVNNVPSYQAVDLLVILPSGSLGPGVPEKSGPLPQIKQSTADKAYTSVAASGTSRFLIWFFSLLVFGFGISGAWLWFWKKRSVDADYNSDGLVYDPPANQSLVSGYMAAQEKRPNKNNAVVATLIDLIARGYYKRDNIRDQAGNWRLEISLPESRDTSQTITNGEAAVITYFDQLLISGPCIVDNLDSRVSRTQEDHDRYQAMVAALMAETAGAKKMQKSRGWLAKPPAIIWLLFVAWLTSFLTIPVGVGQFIAIVLGFFVAVLIILSVILWPRADFVKSDEAAMAMAGPWRGWRDFILTFSSMETAPDLQVILWERAFAGALLFGVAKEFTERAKVLVPNLPDNTTSLADTAFYSIALGSSLSSSSTPPSSSGDSFGGGGGFSGGGSGGGGGGAW